MFCQNSTVLSAVVAPRWARCRVRSAGELEGTVARVAGWKNKKQKQTS